MDNQELLFTLCEGEKVIRNYEVTHLRRLFSNAARGYLTITNQRVVYHSQAKSATGESQVISEIPLDDVSGLSTSMSASFNWIILILLAVLLYFANRIIFDILPTFLTHWVVGIILILPITILLLFEKNVLSTEIRNQASKRIQEFTSSGPLKDKQSSFYRPIFKVLFIIGADLLLFNIAFSSDVFYQMPWLTFILVIVASFLVYILLLGRNRIFTLQIGSKSAQGYGINIEGDPITKLFGGDRTAIQTLQAGPGNDADEVIHELGAMLTDIRLLGDLGIQKWMNNPTE